MVSKRHIKKPPNAPPDPPHRWGVTSLDLSKILQKHTKTNKTSAQIDLDRCTPSDQEILKSWALLFSKVLCILLYSQIKQDRLTNHTALCLRLGGRPCGDVLRSLPSGSLEEIESSLTLGVANERSFPWPSRVLLLDRCLFIMNRWSER
jgi:hypothetical protein